MLKLEKNGFWNKVKIYLKLVGIKNCMFQNYLLDKDGLNLIYVPVGKLPKTKAEIFCKDLSKQFTNLGYQVVIIGVPEGY